MIRFVMPSRYTVRSLPKPKNAAIRIKEIPGRRFAAIRFSGLPNDGNLQEYTTTLKKFISESQMDAISYPTYAFYDPPWTLPFLRRNEVLIEAAVPDHAVEPPDQMEIRH